MLLTLLLAISITSVADADQPPKEGCVYAYAAPLRELPLYAPTTITVPVLSIVTALPKKSPLTPLLATSTTSSADEIQPPDAGCEYTYAAPVLVLRAYAHTTTIEPLPLAATLLPKLSLLVPLLAISITSVADVDQPPVAGCVYTYAAPRDELRP
jgi:hypothetical protein